MNTLLMPPFSTNPTLGKLEFLDGSEQATALSFNNNGSLLAVGGQQGRIALWDFTTFKTVIKIFDPKEIHHDIHNDKEIMKNIHLLSEDNVHAAENVRKISSIHWSCDDAYLLVGCLSHTKKGLFVVWDIKKETICFVMP